MERIEALIDKLYQQRQQNCNPAQLLVTVQLLQSELLKLQQKNGTIGSTKVAVTLPINLNFSEEIADQPPADLEGKSVPPSKEKERLSAPEPMAKNEYIPRPVQPQMEAAIP